MRKGVSYITTLLIVGCIYFGSLLYVSKPSRECTPYINDKSNLINTDAEFGVQEPFSQVKDSEEDLLAEQEDKLLEYSNTFIEPIIEYSKVDIKPTCKTFESSKKKEKAVIVILVRNNELIPMRRTLRQFEDRFNRKYNYDYVFFNDEPFTDEFKKSVSSLTNARVKFGLVPESMWSVPKHVNQTIMNQQLQDYANRNIMYGGSLSYRHMCRFNSGFFYRHPLLKEYDYYWRVEPGVSFFCDMDYDPFKFMRENGKEYGFTITLKEIPETIPTLWDHTMKFAHKHELNTTLLKFFGDPYNGYNLCHYWSNFEIANLNLWRSDKYQAYFDYLDSTGNFFYERWGDAIVHSLAAGLFLNKSQVHFFNDIGYQHDKFAHCSDDGVYGKCLCPDVPNFDYMWGSCLQLWNNYREEGYQWDFKKDGDQHLDNGQILKKSN